MLSLSKAGRLGFSEGERPTAVSSADLEAIAAQAGHSAAEVERALVHEPLSEFSPEAHPELSGWEGIDMEPTSADASSSSSQEELEWADLELRAVVHELLDAIPENQATVLALEYGLRGERAHSRAEIAQRCGMKSRQLVMHHMRKGSTRLKERLEARKEEVVILLDVLD